MAISAKKFKSGINLEKTPLEQAQISGAAFSTAVVGQIRYNTTANSVVSGREKGISWWDATLGGGTERSLNDVAINELAAPTAVMNIGAFTFSTSKTTFIDSELVTKLYVDSVAQGLDTKTAARLATTQNANWTGAASLAFSAGTLTITGLTAGTSRGLIDSVEPVDGDRILIKDAGAASAGAAADDIYNGWWDVTGGTTTSLTLTRSDDADVTGEVIGGSFSFIQEGAINADSGWVVITNGTITINTTAIDYAQFNSAGSVSAGTSIGVSGSTVSVDFSASTSTITSVATGNLLGIHDGAQKNITVGSVLTAFAGNGLAVSGTSLTFDISAIATAITAVGATDVLAIYDGAQKKIVVSDFLTAIAGTGLSYATGDLNLNITGLTAAVIDTADEIAFADTSASGAPRKETVGDLANVIAGLNKYAASFGNGSLTTIPINHALNDLDVIIQIREVSTGELFETDVEIVDADNINIFFTVAPTTNQYRVVVMR